MIDYISGSSGFIGKALMRRIGSGAIAVPHNDIPNTAFGDCDRFFFLSTYGNYVGQDDVSEILRSNIGHLGYVLGAYMEESKCNHFTYISSSSVNLPVQTAYSRSKRAGEEMVLASGLRAVVARPFSVTGVGEQAEHLIPTLIRSCMEGELMQLVPEPVHDFVDVSDLIDGILLLSEKKMYGVFEFGTGTAFSNGEVRAMVERITGKRGRYRIVESLRPYDSSNWICKDTLTRDLGWEPKKFLEQSITEMVDAYKFQRKNR